MKLNEIIELNGKEYTVELNRESIVRIEQYTNLKSVQEKLNQVPYTDKSTKEVELGEDPFAEPINEEIGNEQDEILRKTFIKSFWIWLYPTEKLNIKEVEEIINPYLQDDAEKASYLVKKYEEFSKKSVEIRETYLQEQKNLKALTK